MNLPVRVAGNSLVSWIATRPLLALIIATVILMIAAGISAKITRDRILNHAEQMIQIEKEALKEREKKYKKDFEMKMSPILRERDSLKQRLNRLEGARSEIKPPESPNEVISRFRALGY